MFIVHTAYAPRRSFRLYVAACGCVVLAAERMCMRFCLHDFGIILFFDYIFFFCSVRALRSFRCFRFSVRRCSMTTSIWFFSDTRIDSKRWKSMIVCMCVSNAVLSSRWQTVIFSFFTFGLQPQYVYLYAPGSQPLSLYRTFAGYLLRATIHPHFIQKLEIYIHSRASVGCVCVWVHSPVLDMWETRVCRPWVKAKIHWCAARCHEYKI